MGNWQHILSRIQEDTKGQRPHYERYSLLAIPPTIRQLFGEEVDGLAEEVGLSPTDKVVSFILDGLGLLKLQRLEEEGALELSRFREEGFYLPLTSVFPPTTTTALATLSTGASPLRHGVLGYTMFLQDPGAVVNMIKLSTPGAGADTLKKVGIKPEEFLPVRTLYQTLEAQGVATYLFLPKYIADSGLSQLLYGGIKETVPYISLSDLFMLLRQAVRRPGRALLGVYWPTGDSLGHMYGPSSPAFSTEITCFFQLLSREFLAHLSGAAVLLVADHGFVDIDPRVDVVSCPHHRELREGLLLPPVGEPRASYLFVRRGKEEQVRNFFLEKFPQEFLVLTVEEALDRGLWGLELPDPE
ncbi:MAG TPA: hypothetical protein ENI38_00050, partial [Candidatus Acetothermia bacterium]|nr:hypothetical protein [Candidatus Acetothermia bacterium]